MHPNEDGPPQILIVDANERNATLLSSFLEAEGYAPTVATTLDNATEISLTNPTELAIIDIDRFDNRVWSVCTQLQETGVPFLILSKFRTASLQRESQAHGAIAFLDKPLVMYDFRERINAVLNA